MAGQPESGSMLDHQGATRRIFLVHLRLDADPARGAINGRVQHVSTGDAMHFESVDELVAFLAHSLSETSG